MALAHWDVLNPMSVREDQGRGRGSGPYRTSSGHGRCSLGRSRIDELWSGFEAELSRRRSGSKGGRQLHDTIRPKTVLFSDWKMSMFSPEGLPFHL